MPRLLPLLIALLAGVAAAFALAACGSGGDRSALIPAGDADTLRDRISAVEDALEEGECATIGADVQALRDAVVALPSTVDSELRAELERGVDNVAALAPEQCDETETTDTTTTETTEPDPTETTETTDTTETETAPETTTTTQIPTTTTPVPPPTTPTTPPDTGGVPPAPGGPDTGGAPSDILPEGVP